MTDKEKLVELLESARYWGSGTPEETADRLIANGVTVQAWVGVEDRLPEIGERVLTYDRHGNIRNRALKRIGNTELFSPDGLRAKEHITHWMPLPKPPQGK